MAAVSILRGAVLGRVLHLISWSLFPPDSLLDPPDLPQLSFPTKHFRCSQAAPAAAAPDAKDPRALGVPLS